MERNEDLKIMRIYTKHFFTSVKHKIQKNGKNDPIFVKNEVYASFTDVLRMSYGGLTNVLRMSYNSLLIIQMLKFKIKTRYKCPEFRKMRLMRILRIFYGYSMILY